jgi:hypothetical protein
MTQSFIRYRRCLLALAALCAFAVTGCAADSEKTIGSSFPTIDTIELTVNLWTWFGDPPVNDEYFIDVKALTVTYNTDAPVSTTADAMRQLVEALQGAPYRTIEECEIWAVDAGVRSPRIGVSHGAEHAVFSVSDNDCAVSNYSYLGPVIRCADFGAILDLLKRMAPHGDPADCQEYW